MKDYYAILGIASDASKDVVKIAYRRKAWLLHPDRNKAPEATDHFATFRKPMKHFLTPVVDRSTMRIDAVIFSISLWKLRGKSGKIILKEYCSEAVAIL